MEAVEGEFITSYYIELANEQSNVLKATQRPEYAWLTSTGIILGMYLSRESKLVLAYVKTMVILINGTNASASIGICTAGSAFACSRNTFPYDGLLPKVDLTLTL